jgi:hypothetical protein
MTMSAPTLDSPSVLFYFSQGSVSCLSSLYSLLIFLWVFEAVTLVQVGYGLPQILKTVIGNCLDRSGFQVRDMDQLPIGMLVENSLHLFGPGDVTTQPDQLVPGQMGCGDPIILHPRSMTRRGARLQVTTVTLFALRLAHPSQRVMEPEPFY